LSCDTIHRLRAQVKHLRHRVLPYGRTNVSETSPGTHLDQGGAAHEHHLRAPSRATAGTRARGTSVRECPSRLSS